MKLSKIFLLLILFIVLNIALLFKVTILKNECNQLIKNSIDLTSQIQNQKKLITKCFDEYNITYDDIVQCLPTPIKTGYNWIVIVSSDVCMACICSLFSELKNIDIQQDRIYLIHEVYSEKLKREWLSYGFKNYIVCADVLKNISLDSGILLLRNSDNDVKYFPYDIEYYDILPIFFKDHNSR